LKIRQKLIRNHLAKVVKVVHLSSSEILKKEEWVIQMEVWETLILKQVWVILMVHSEKEE
jgi:hypothetical protein